jgi:pimeloyl-ACP methyl ester carboxylesterase
VRPLLNRLLFFPSRRILQTPKRFDDLTIPTADGQRLHGWWMEADEPHSTVLFLHGNAGNIGDRVPHYELLTAAGFNVLAFDYRGYGRSTGRPTEAGTYVDARAARDALPEDHPVIYVGESLGGAIALELALHRPPNGLVLQSTFTSIRHMARLHYPIVPSALVPDAYPSLDRIKDLKAPLLVLHGRNDEIVPLMDGQALYDAAPEPKQIRILDAGHNDLVGREWIEAQVSAATSLW